MCSLSQSFSLLIMLILAASSIIVVEPAFAQSMPKPSAPEFTVRFLDDPAEQSVVITIRNQVFPVYIDAKGEIASLYFLVRFRISGAEWDTFPVLPKVEGYIESSKGEYTIISLPDYVFETTPSAIEAINQTLEDFQVQAFIGLENWVNPNRFISEDGGYTFTGETSDWSSIQTVDIQHLNVTVLSPQPEEYNSTDVTLNFTVSKPVSQLEYSLDGNGNVTVSGNTTLAGLPNGGHNIIVYAVEDTGYVAASSNTYFKIDVLQPTSLPNSESFPTLQIAILAIVVLTVAVFSVLLYRRHRT